MFPHLPQQFVEALVAYVESIPYHQSFEWIMISHSNFQVLESYQIKISMYPYSLFFQIHFLTYLLFLATLQEFHNGSEKENYVSLLF